MQLGVTFVVNVLLCVLIWTCKGAPDAAKSKQKARYTEIEDKSIFDELSKLLDGRTPVFRREVWRTVAEKHREKWKARTEGFPQERSRASLLARFRDILLRRKASITLTVPRSLMEKIRDGEAFALEQGRKTKSGYTNKENEFLIEELRKPSITKLFGRSTFEAIRVEHDKKRLANTQGFENERSITSLRNQLLRLRQQERLPKEVFNKLQYAQEGDLQDAAEADLPDGTGASSSTSTAQNQETDLQETMHDELMDEETAYIFQDILDKPICDIGDDFKRMGYPDLP